MYEGRGNLGPVGTAEAEVDTEELECSEALLSQLMRVRERVFGLVDDVGSLRGPLRSQLIDGLQDASNRLGQVEMQLRAASAPSADAPMKVEAQAS